MACSLNLRRRQAKSRDGKPRTQGVLDLSGTGDPDDGIRPRGRGQSATTLKASKPRQQWLPDSMLSSPYFLLQMLGVACEVRGDSHLLEVLTRNLIFCGESDARVILWCPSRLRRMRKRRLTVWWRLCTLGSRVGPRTVEVVVAILSQRFRPLQRLHMRTFVLSYRLLSSGTA